MLTKKIEELREEIIGSTQEILKIKSVEGEPKENMPCGEEINKALLYALKLSEDLGFKTKNLDGYVGYAEYGEGEDYIAVLGHLDLVPEGEGWMYDPYAAEIHDGKLYGRGTADDKGPIIAALYGLKAIKDLGLKMSRRVRIIFGTSEETGGPDIEYYLKHEKPPVLGFTPDAEYPIIFAEKGIVRFTLDKKLNANSNIKVKYVKAGDRVNIVPDYCEALIEGMEFSAVEEKLNSFKTAETKVEIEKVDEGIKVKGFGTSAHGSTPEIGHNAIMELVKFLNYLNVGGDMGELFSFLDKSIGLEVNGESFGVGFEDKPSGKLSFNVGIINITETEAKVRVDIRYPVTLDKNDVISNLEKKAKEIDGTVGDIQQQDPLYFSKDHELIVKLQKVYTEQTGKEATLLAIGGGTYAKEMPNIVAFGPTFPGEPDVIHQPNEFIKVEDLILNAKIYGNAIYELAK
ncbi:dipeptidase PepV [Clostridium frigidicarnis]|uniref:Succinyl-diaminopimelate desuccinylase n=1 Tax=Clostridium frigidicarnis TaxID=84698 RepID=A0A1I1A025_9CLOT|nr:dipeptidase PepV [Clostridium frigidicarnis]SFB29918.1 succinyl-diaminopimelate desuccinylase [Clostridium frigidicarnis]